MKRRLERDPHLDDAIKKISDIMVEKGISQSELARRMDSDRAGISNILKLKVDPQFSTVLAMLHALDTEITLRSLEHSSSSLHESIMPTL